MGYLRALYDWPADGFDLDFRDRAAAQQIFEEGLGSLLTDGTRACMEASHLQYDQLLDAESGARGLRLLFTREHKRTTWRATVFKIYY